MTIDFNEITPSHTPRSEMELDRTGGLSGLPRDVKKLLVMGYKLTAGALGDGVVKQITSVAQAKADWGEGSHVAVMAEAALDVAKRSPIYGMSYAEGGAAVATTKTITLTNSASKSGTLKVNIGGKVFQAGYAKDDTPTAIGDELVKAVAQKGNLPFTVANAAGVVTMTARNKGPEGETLRVRAEVTPNTGVAVAVAAGANGATAGDPTTELTGIEGERFHLVALNNSESTPLGALSAHQEKQSAPDAQKWGVGVAAAVGTRSAAESLAAADDSYNNQILWQQDAELPIFELAARFAAYRSSKAANVGVMDAKVPGILPTADRTKWPKPSEIEAAIKGGLTPIRMDDSGNGDTEVVRSVLTRQTDPISYRDHNYEEIWHYTSEAILTRMRAFFKSRRLKSASPPGRPDTITPDRATALLNAILFDLDKQDYLQGVQASIKAGNNFAEVNAIEPTSRLDAAFDFIPVGMLVQFAGKGTFKRPRKLSAAL